MIIVRRALVFIEWALIVLFSLMLLILAIDLPSAWYAEPCGAGAGQGCYPWGGEGPVAGAWHYASKRNYLASGMLEAMLTSVTLFGTLIVSRGRRILVLLPGVACLYLGDLLLPRVMS